jgi:hypothetical protein
MSIVTPLSSVHTAAGYRFLQQEPEADGCVA